MRSNCPSIEMAGETDKKFKVTSNLLSWGVGVLLRSSYLVILHQSTSNKSE